MNKKLLPVVNPYERALERGLRPEAPKRPKPASSENTAERLVINFTRLPEKLIEMALGATINYTPIETQEKPELSEAAKLAAARKQLQYVQGEIAAAKQQLGYKENQRKEDIMRADQNNADQERQSAMQQHVEPSSKATRGNLFGRGKKKVQKTIENKASQGKN